MYAVTTQMIDLDRASIPYLEQSLDGCHIFMVEFSRLLDELYKVTIDG